MAQTEQAKMLKNAQKQLGLTREQLAGQLGVVPSTMNSWLLPKTSKAHRPMSRTAELLLERILSDAKAKKGKG